MNGKANHSLTMNMNSNVYMTTKKNISKEHLEAVIESSTDAILIANKKGEIVSWNHRCSLLFGFSAEEAIGQNIDIIIPREMHDLHHKGMDNFVSGGKKKIIGQTVTLDGLRKDGSTVPIELSLSSWEEDSVRMFVCGIMRDISQRKNNERQILDLRGIIDSSPSCLKLVNQKGELLMMNSVGLDLIEAENFTIVDRANVYDIVHEKDRDSFKKFNEFICNGGKGTLIFKIVGLNGTTRIMETFARAHELESGEIAHLAITNDISDRIKTESELLQKNQELEEAKRLSVIGEFAAGIAHEINNPLAVIYSKAQLLEIQLNQLAEQKTDYFKNITDSLESIKRMTIHTSDLIKNLKTFSSKGNFEKLETVKLTDVINMVLNISEKRCSNAGIKIIIDIDPNIKLTCSPAGLAQVILNLVSNSIDAIESQIDKWISVVSNISNDTLKIIITDSGNGIPNDIAKKITQPFFSTKDPGKGTGLGLAISTKSVEKMKGHLYYNSKSVNTQFVIEFKSFER